MITPSPKVAVMWNARVDGDRPRVHVTTIIDVPAFLAGIGRSAAGQGGHVPHDSADLNDSEAATA
jgi:hypothetical protein